MIRRVRMTPPVRLALWALLVYVVVMLALIGVKFIQVVL